MWLLKRLCLLYLYNEPICASDEMEKLLGEDGCFMDKILIYVKRESELMSSEVSAKFSENKKFMRLWDILKSSKEYMKHTCRKLQKEYYVVLLRMAINISISEAEKITVELPEWLKGEIEIQGLILHIKIEKGEAIEEEVIKTCISTGKYWLLNNYLIRQDGVAEKVLKVLEKYPFVIDDDIQLFVLYAQAVRIVKGKEESAKLLVQYKEKYAEYLEYWIEVLTISNSNENVDEFMGKWTSKELKHIFSETEEMLCELLLKHGKYDEALEIVKKFEAIQRTNIKILRMKATILMNKGHNLEALYLLNNIFEKCKKDERVIDTIMGLSIENNRPVSEEILEIAISIGSSRLLMLSAIIYEKNGKHEEAKNLMMRALLKSEGDNTDIFGNYLKIHLVENNKSSVEIEGVDINTVVILECKENQESKVYCIYENKILPEEPWLWENAVHIYVDTAIQMGLLRKKVGLDIEIEGVTYIVKDIITLDCYFFRICVDKMVSAGIAKQILVPVGDNEQSRKEMLEILKENMPEEKETFNWFEHYQDMQNMTVTLYSLKRFVNVTYVQLVLTVIEEKSIIFREIINLNNVSGNKFILSFAAMVALYKLNFPIEKIDNRDIYITESTLNEILEETDDIISRYKQEHVATMGKVDGEVFFQESVEEEKQRWMSEAVGIKQYCQRISTVNNQKDIKVDALKDIDCKDFLGICDYDAFALAINSEMILVNAEVPIMAMAKMEECEVKAIGIIDFFSEMELDASELIDYINKMIEYRFNVVVTDNVIKKLSDMYQNATGDEQDIILQKWNQCLLSTQEIEGKYKEHFISLITNIFKRLHDEERMKNPIWRCFALYVMKYNNVKMQLVINEDGEVNLEVSY